MTRVEPETAPVPDVGTLQSGTLPRAALLAGGVLLVLGVVAFFFTGSTSAKPPLDRYIRLGPSGGATQLRQDLLAEYPEGGQVTPLLIRLEHLGFACRPGLDDHPTWACVAQVQRDRSSLTRIEADVTGPAERLQSLTTRIATATP